MDETYFKKIGTIVVLAILIVLSFFLLRPILLSVVLGIFLAFLFSPVYDWLDKKIKMKNLSAILISTFLILLIILPVWFLTPIMIDQSLKIYQATQHMDFVKPLKAIFPSLFASDAFSREVGSIIYSFVNNLANSIVNSFSKLILNFVSFSLQLAVVFFTFYFVLRDKNRLILYIRSLLPFSKEVENKLFEQTRGITKSILYGQLIIGLIQGLIAGIGFFIFGVSNALFLTLAACLAAVFPIIGTPIIWVPVAIYSFVGDNSIQGFGVIVFGLIASSIDNVLRPIIVSHRTSMPVSIILIGMIGGYFLFGILGFILGPLILAYLLILLELYRNKKIPGLLVQEPPEKLKISI